MPGQSLDKGIECEYLLQWIVAQRGARLPAVLQYQSNYRRIDCGHKLFLGWRRSALLGSSRAAHNSTYQLSRSLRKRCRGQAANHFVRRRRRLAPTTNTLHTDLWRRITRWDAVRGWWPSRQYHSGAMACGTVQTQRRRLRFPMRRNNCECPCRHIGHALLLGSVGE